VTLQAVAHLSPLAGTVAVVAAVVAAIVAAASYTL